jgi:GNAT superfamily N-acetyltransferase
MPPGTSHRFSRVTRDKNVLLRASRAECVENPDAIPDVQDGLAPIRVRHPIANQTRAALTPDRPPLKLELTGAPDAATREAIARSMLNYNETLLGPPETRPLAVLVRSADGAGVVGGLWGRTSHRWLFVEMVFLPDALRGCGIGEDLIRMAETEALARGCIGAWLDTFSPGARRFYERHGYERFGEIDDYPPGQARFFMRKRFDPMPEPHGTGRV